MGLGADATRLREALVERDNQNEGSSSGAREAVVFNVPKAAGVSRSQVHADAALVVTDYMLNMHAQEPRVRTGGELASAEYRKLIAPALDAILPPRKDGLKRQTLYVLFDDCRGVPRNKAPEQAKRQRGKVPVRPDYEIGEDVLFPDMSAYDRATMDDQAWTRAVKHELSRVMSTSLVRARFVEFLISQWRDLVERHTRGASDRYGTVVVKTPYRAVCDYGDARLVSGEYVELTGTGARFPRPTPQGEADTLAKAVTDFFHRTHPLCQRPLLVCSKDGDTIPIFVCTPPRGHVVVHAASKGTEYTMVNMRVLYDRVLQGSRAHALSFALALILGRCDYCEGVWSVGALRLARTLLGLAPSERSGVARPSLFTVAELPIAEDAVTGKISLREDKLQQLLLRARANVRKPLLRQPHAHSRARWTLKYWASGPLARIPDPFEKRGNGFAGWCRDADGKVSALEDEEVVAVKLARAKKSPKRLKN